LVKVTIHYGHPLTEITGKAREEVIVKKGSNVLSLLRNLAIKYGDAFKDHVFSNYERNQVKEGIIISLNAKYISDETKKVKIEDDAFIGIFRAVGGG
jgi:sulfur carrier protein ThiS